MLAFVLNRYGKPLMPCKPQKAKMVRKFPFLIKLNDGTSCYKQKLAGGQDSGSKVIGSGDVAVIASRGKPVKLLGQTLIRQYVAKGDCQQTKRMRSEKSMPTGKLFGLRKFDLTQTSQDIGFVKGKRSSDYFSIGDILGKAIYNAVKVKTDITRLSARNITLTAMENFASTMRS